MTTMLGDLPDARDFISRVVNAAEDIAIAVTGEPDYKVEASLRETSANLRRDLAPLLGAKGAAQFADLFCRAVRGEKHERETLVAMGLL
jgi:hypothetical protein